jgi:hypothetical protein
LTEIKGVRSRGPRIVAAAHHAGDEVALDPESNIHLGARILQEYVRSSRGMPARSWPSARAWRF